MTLDIKSVNKDNPNLKIQELLKTSKAEKR